jgi:hypothetical protein
VHWRKDFKLGFEEEEKENLIFLAFFPFIIDEGLCKIMIM